MNQIGAIILVREIWNDNKTEMINQIVVSAVVFAINKVKNFDAHSCDASDFQKYQNNDFLQTAEEHYATITEEMKQNAIALKPVLLHILHTNTYTHTHKHRHKQTYRNTFSQTKI